MRRFVGFGLVAFLVHAAVIAGFSQLRNVSEFSQDRINTEKTYFMLHDTGAAEFAWASEWTYATVDGNEEKAAMFLWRFKDGSTAYSKAAECIGDMGKSTGFLLTGQSTDLEDIHRKHVQPLSRNNFPVKIELWIGKISDSSGYSPESLGEALCLGARSIEPNRKYQFSACP